MNRFARTVVAYSLVAGFTLAACGGSSDSYTVGDSSTVVVEEPTEPSIQVDDDFIVEIKNTELPPEWPSDIPIPGNATIDNVIQMDESITVTWLVPKDSPASVTSEYSDALIAAGYEYGQSEGSDSFGRGAFSNDTHTVDFTITPWEGDQLQFYVVYAPNPN